MPGHVGRHDTGRLRVGPCQAREAGAEPVARYGSWVITLQFSPYSKFRNQPAVLCSLYFHQLRYFCCGRLIPTNGRQSSSLSSPLPHPRRRTSVPAPAADACGAALEATSMLAGGGARSPHRAATPTVHRRDPFPVRPSVPAHPRPGRSAVPRRRGNRRLDADDEQPRNPSPLPTTLA
jgi:hypothetical protein